MNRIKFKIELKKMVKGATASAFDLENLELSDIEIVVPNSDVYGEFSTNFCLKKSKVIKESPRKVAEQIKDILDNKSKQSEFEKIIRKIKIEGPGFLNFYLSDKIKNKWLQNIYDGTYLNGIDKVGKKEKVSIEFVSANPTGPLTIAHARQAVIGDCISNIHNICGYEVTKEYYINNEGGQIKLLGKSVKARCLELLGMKAAIPEGGYKGDYLVDVARKLLNDISVDKVKNNKYPDEFYSDRAVQIIMDKIKFDLKRLGVLFHKWPKQSEMTQDNRLKKLFKKLKEKNYLYKKDGALWFKSTDFGDSKDRVLIKKNGEYTYFSPDIVYHKLKLNENDKLIDIWGPDHHGYIARVKAAIEAMGYDTDLLNVLIVQLTTVYNKGKPLSMSKREGEFVSLEDVFKILGRDATRFFLLMRKSDSHLDFDLEVAKKHSSDNPVYYIQYAHARICSIREKAIERFGQNKLFEKLKTVSHENLKKLNTSFEVEVVNKLLRLSDDILISLESLEPYRIIIYLQELASNFHKYYHHKRVLIEDEELTLSRLYLCECIRKTLIQGLNLLGIESPDTM